MTAPGTLTDTYVAAIQHDLVELPPQATLVGVVRQPTRWLHPVVDENNPALGPPADLLSDVKRVEEDLQAQGAADAAANHRAWEETGFADRYRRYLDDDPDAGAALESLADRLRTGETLALVCYENTDEKRCHRTILRERLAAMVPTSRANADG